MFDKMKDIFQKDPRTANFAVYGGQYSKLKTFPCIVIFPGDKEWITEDNQNNYRRTGVVKRVEYNFILFLFQHLMELEDSYYSTDNGVKAGITQVATEVEAVIKDNKTGRDLNDNENILWFDTQMDTIKVVPKYSKLMSAVINIKLVSKEVE